MQFLVIFEVKNETIHQNEISYIRKELQAQIKKIRSSHKLKAGGVFADSRGGFLILDVVNALELNSLLAPAIMDLCIIKTHPVMSFDEIDALFTKLNASTQQHMQNMKQKIQQKVAEHMQRVQIHLKQPALEAMRKQAPIQNRPNLQKSMTLKPMTKPLPQKQNQTRPQNMQKQNAPSKNPNQRIDKR